VTVTLPTWLAWLLAGGALAAFVAVGLLARTAHAVLVAEFGRDERGRAR
jgi:hypothetical protein